MKITSSSFAHGAVIPSRLGKSVLKAKQNSPKTVIQN